MAWDESTWVVAPADGSGALVELAVDGFAVQQPRFAPAGTDLAYLADRDGWLNLWLFGPERDVDAPLVAEPHEHGEPTWGQGQRSFVWSPDGTAIAFCRNEDGFGRLCVVDVASGAVRDVARAVHGSLSWRGATLVALRSGATTPTQLVAYDAGTHGEGSWDRRVLAVGPVAGFEPHLVEPEPVTFPGGDGDPVHGRLYRPASGTSPGPCLLWIHGGPTGQWPVTFNARIAFWLARGWSVLLVDHRGSTGFGRAYTQALTGRWGELDSADAAAAADAAMARGWARPGGLVATGGSAGGLTVLNLLRHRPGLVAAGVVLYPVSDLRALDHTTHRFEAHYNGRLVGPWPDAAAAYRERSPAFAAGAIEEPLLVLHGDADPVVPVGQSHALVAALRAAGRPVTLHVYEGQGHGWSDPAVVADELERTERFLADVVR
jgi:dipeptidyl aminopeptidase/acylaminoacyl peptidase